MGLKKYEIITVGSDKRVRALRSWQVGDRYVNIGDVGGIVYDEKTLSQDGACWLFRGNFGFPGARIGGDSIVDVGEATLSTASTPAVDILGSSVVVGGKLLFESDQTAEDALVLGAEDFEQGTLSYVLGTNWETMKAPSGNYLRTKNPIFAGGASTVLKCEVPGYLLNWYALDRDGVTINASAMVTTGVGVTTTVTPCQYFLVKLSKNPNAPIVPADAADAQITFTGIYETKLSVIDSRVEINPAAGARASIIKPGASYTMTSGAKYPEAIIRNSKVSLNAPANDGRVYRLLVQIIGSTATLDSTAGHVLVAGRYINVNNLTIAGILASRVAGAHDCIQATNCDNFAVSPTIFPGLAAAQTANMPFIFQGCNVPNGIFYHHAQIANTYKNIDFAKASVDLGKSIASDGILASSEVEGMYRIYFAVFGALVESYDSVKSLNMVALGSSYGTTIYKDAYVSGKFDFAGTNVFGNTKKHDTQDVSGCKIVNTGETAVNIKGNIRVEDNATLVNTSITGSGYFGGNSVTEYQTTIPTPMLIEGAVYMNDNAVFSPTVSAAGAGVSLLDMRDNALFAGTLNTAAMFYNITMADNAEFRGSSSTRSGLVMRGNSLVASGCTLLAASKGLLEMEGNSRVESGNLAAVGHITLTGDYRQTANKKWTGKRVISSQDAPEYDNNVKTQYDF